MLIFSIKHTKYIKKENMYIYILTLDVSNVKKNLAFVTTLLLIVTLILIET